MVLLLIFFFHFEVISLPSPFVSLLCLAAWVFDLRETTNSDQKSKVKKNQLYFVIYTIPNKTKILTQNLKHNYQNKVNFTDRNISESFTNTQLYSSPYYHNFL